MGSDVVIRSRLGVVTTVASGLLGAGLLVDASVRGGISEAISLAPWVILVVWMLWLYFGSSHIRLRSDAVIVQNYLRQIVIPWTAVADITFRFHVIFALVDGGVVHAAVAPSSIRTPQRRGRSADSDDRISPALSDLNMIRDAWRQVERSDAATVSRGWDVPTLIVGVLAALAAIVSMFG